MALTTINTIEDLIKLLDEKPEWLEAVRARILTRELLELPQTLAEFVETTNRRFDEADRRFNSLEESINAVQGGIKSRIRNDLGVLKGGHARTSAYREPSAITDGLGLNRVGILDYDALRDLTLSANVAGIPANEIASFRRADMILVATDQSDQTCYVAVEISFTANGRDTTRASRNAAFLTRFTGCPAYAVIAGMYRDNRIQDEMDAGNIHWHQLDAEDLEVE